MTEKTMLEKINDLLTTSEDDEKRQAFLNDFDDFLANYRQPAYAVGEYVAVEMGADLSGLMRIEELKDTQDSEGDKVAGCWGRVFNTALNDFDGYSSFELSMTKPATAEQIATFKRAEHFADHGRKLDEFRVGDYAKVIKNLDLFTVRDVHQRDDILYIGDHDAANEFLALECIIDQTAEELREVENNE